MKLIVGLGNPGEKYKNNRHNVGFMAVDVLTTDVKNKNLQFENNKKLACHILHATNYILAKPQTFMNSSGVAVKKLTAFYKVNIPDLWIIHDDLDIKLGQYKIQFGVGPKLHYGIQSIEKELGTPPSLKASSDAKAMVDKSARRGKDFWRVRMGVDNREPDNRISGEDYVLQNFSMEERKIIDGVIIKVVEELKSLIH